MTHRIACHIVFYFDIATGSDGKYYCSFVASAKTNGAAVSEVFCEGEKVSDFKLGRGEDASLVYIYFHDLCISQFGDRLPNVEIVATEYKKKKSVIPFYEPPHNPATTDWLK